MLKIRINTIKDVAKMANVSIKTVSRVINNSPEVAEDTKNKVLNIIKKLNYRPSELARSLATKRSKVLGVIISDITNPFYAELVRGIDDFASSKGYHIIISNTDGIRKKEIECLDTLLKRRVDGIIFTYARLKSEEILDLFSNGFPIILVNRTISGLNSNYIIANDRLGAKLATKHLVELGHVRIGLVSGKKDQTGGMWRTEGYLEILKTYNIKIDNNLIKEGNWTQDSGFKLTKELINLKERPTAIFYENDLMAFGGLNYIHSIGLKVPNDISVVGFDDIIFSSLECVGLTTIRVPKYQIGYLAAKNLISIIEKGIIKKRKKVFDLELIVRNTTKQL